MGSKEHFFILLALFIFLHSESVTKALTESKVNLNVILGAIWL